MIVYSLLVTDRRGVLLATTTPSADSRTRKGTNERGVVRSPDASFAFGTTLNLPDFTLKRYSPP